MKIKVFLSGTGQIEPHGLVAVSYTQNSKQKSGQIRLDSSGNLQLPDDIDFKSLKVSLIYETAGTKKRSPCDLEEVIDSDDLFPEKPENPYGVPDSGATVQATIGETDFMSMVRTDRFIDKTLFIRELLPDPSVESKKSVSEKSIFGDELVSVITRPRRMGKTSNLSMLEAFFSPAVQGVRTKPFFDGTTKPLNISKEKSYLTHYQGQFPVIFVTFKEVLGKTYADAFYDILDVLIEVFQKHVCSSGNRFKEKFLPYEKKFSPIINRELDHDDIKHLGILKRSIKNLSKALYEVHGRKVVILIDEYDTPLLIASKYGYWEKTDDSPGMNSLIQSMITAALKGNTYLFKGVVTGIMRVSGESIFSGMNNVIHFSIFSNKYSEYFGFRRNELEQLLNDKGSGHLLNRLEVRYGFYSIGNTEQIFNPWSVISALSGKHHEWLKSADNVRVTDIFEQNSEELRHVMAQLMQGKQVTLRNIILEKMSYQDLDRTLNKKGDLGSCLSLLLHCGYLTGSENMGNYIVWIPNFEILYFFIKHINLFEFSKEDIEAINHHYEEQKSRVNKQSDINFFCEAEGGGIHSDQEKYFFHSAVAGEVTQILSDNIKKTVIISGPASIGKSIFMTQYAYQHRNRYDCVIVFNKFHNGEEAKNKECAQILKRLFSIVANNRPQSPFHQLLKQLEETSSWLIVISSRPSVSGGINELIELQKKGKDRHVLIESRGVGIKNWTDWPHVYLTVPDEEEAISFLYSVLSKKCPLKKDDIRDTLSKIAYYSNYLPSWMNYFLFLVDKEKAETGEVLSKSFLEKLLIRHMNRMIDYKREFENTEDNEFNDQLLYLITHDKNTRENQIFKRNISRLHELFLSSEKMMTLFSIYLNEKRLSLNSKGFHDLCDELSSQFKNMSINERFRALIVHLLDHIDEKHGKIGDVKSKLLGLSLFFKGIQKPVYDKLIQSVDPDDLSTLLDETFPFSQDASPFEQRYQNELYPKFNQDQVKGCIGRLIQDYLGTNSNDIVSTLINLRFLYGRVELIDKVSINQEIWSEIRRMFLSASFSISKQVELDPNNVLTDLHVLDTNIQWADELLSTVISDSHFDVFRFICPKRSKYDDFQSILNFYPNFIKNITRIDKLSIKNPQTFWLLCIQVSYFLYLHDEIEAAHSLLDQEPKIVSSLSGRYPIKAFLCLLKGKLIERGGKIDGKRSFTEAIECYQKVINNTDIDVIQYNLPRTARRFLIDLLVKLDRIPEAAYYCNQVRAEGKGKGKADESDSYTYNGIFDGHLCLSLANYYFHIANYPEAEHLYARAISFFSGEGIGASASPVYLSRALGYQSSLYRVLGDYDAAGNCLQKSESLLKELYPSDSQLNLRLRLHQAKLQFSQGELTVARKNCLEIIEGLKGRPGKELICLDALHYLARIEDAQRNYEFASEKSPSSFLLQGFQAMLDLVRSGSGFLVDNHPDMHEYSEDFLSEPPFFNSYIRVFHPIFAAMLHYTGLSFLHQGNLTKAREYFLESSQVNAIRYHIVKHISWSPKCDDFISMIDFSSVSISQPEALFYNQGNVHSLLTLRELAKIDFYQGSYSKAKQRLEAILACQDKVYNNKNIFVEDREKTLLILFDLYYCLGLYRHAVSISNRLVDQSLSEGRKRYSYVFQKLYFLKHGLRNEIALLSNKQEWMENPSLGSDQRGKFHPAHSDELSSCLQPILLHIGWGNIKSAISSFYHINKKTTYQGGPISKVNRHLFKSVSLILNNDFLSAKKVLLEADRLLTMQGIERDGNSFARIQHSLVCVWRLIEGAILASEQEILIENEIVSYHSRDALMKAKVDVNEILKKIYTIETDTSLSEVSSSPCLLEKTAALLLWVKINTILTPKDLITVIDVGDNIKFHIDDIEFHIEDGNEKYHYLYHPIWRHIIINRCPFWFRINNEKNSFQSKLLTALERVDSGINKGVPFYGFLILEKVFLLRQSGRRQEAQSILNEYALDKYRRVFSSEINHYIGLSKVLIDSEVVFYNSTDVKERSQAERQLSVSLGSGRGTFVYNRFYQSYLKSLSNMFAPSNQGKGRRHAGLKEGFIEEYFKCLLPAANVVYHASDRLFSDTAIKILRSYTDQVRKILNRASCCIMQAPAGTGKSVVTQEIIKSERISSRKSGRDLEVLWFSQSPGLPFESMMTHYLLAEYSKNLYHLPENDVSAERFQEYINRVIKKCRTRDYLIVLEGFRTLKGFCSFFEKYLSRFLSRHGRCRLLVSVSQGKEAINNKIFKRCISYYPSSYDEDSKEVRLGSILFKSLMDLKFKDEFSQLMRSSFGNGASPAQSPRTDKSGEKWISEFYQLVRNDIFSCNLLMTSLQLYFQTNEIKQNWEKRAKFREVVNYIKVHITGAKKKLGKRYHCFSALIYIWKKDFFGTSLTMEFGIKFFKLLSILDSEYLSKTLVITLFQHMKNGDACRSSDLCGDKEVVDLHINKEVADKLIQFFIASSLFTPVSESEQESYYRIHPLARYFFLQMFEEGNDKQEILSCFAHYFSDQVNYDRSNPETIVDSSPYLQYALKFVSFVSSKGYLIDVRKLPKYLNLEYCLSAYYLFHLRMPSATCELLRSSYMREDARWGDAYRSLLCYAHYMLGHYALAKVSGNLVIDNHEKSSVQGMKSSSDDLGLVEYERQQGFLNYAMLMINFRSHSNFNSTKVDLRKIIDRAERLEQNELIRLGDVDLKERLMSEKIILKMELINVIFLELESLGKSIGVQKRRKKIGRLLNELNGYLVKIKEYYKYKPNARIIIAELLRLRLLSNSPTEQKKLLESIERQQLLLFPFGSKNIQTVEILMLKGRLLYEHPELFRSSKHPFVKAKECLESAVRIVGQLGNVDSYGSTQMECYFSLGKIQLFFGEFKNSSDSFHAARNMSTQLSSGIPASQSKEVLAHQIEFRYFASLFLFEQYEELKRLISDYPYTSIIYQLNRIRIEIVTLCFGQNTELMVQGVFPKTVRDKLRRKYSKLHHMIYTKPVSHAGPVLHGEFSLIMAEHLLGWSAFMGGGYKEAISHADKGRAITDGSDNIHIKDYKWFLDTLQAFALFKQGYFYKSFSVATEALLFYRASYVDKGVLCHPKLSELLLVFIASSFKCLSPYPVELKQEDGIVIAYLMWVIEINPWLSSSNCYTYLKKVCELEGYLSFDEKGVETPHLDYSGERNTKRVYKAIQRICDHIKTEEPLLPEQIDELSEVEPSDNKQKDTPFLVAISATNSPTTSLKKIKLSGPSSSVPSLDIGTSKQGSDIDSAVALRSQRCIYQVRVHGEDRPCRVVAVKTDGNCGFSAVAMSLRFQNNSLYQSIDRASYKKLVLERLKKSNDDDELLLIHNLFEQDKAISRHGKLLANDWPRLFGERWLELVDLKFLSKCYNICFRVYYESNGRFELRYDGDVYTGDSPETATVVSLAHLSTKLKNERDASLNHFEALVINPRAEQVAEINRINAKIEAEINNPKVYSVEDILRSEKNSNLRTGGASKDGVEFPPRPVELPHHFPDDNLDRLTFPDSVKRSGKFHKITVPGLRVLQKYLYEICYDWYQELRARDSREPFIEGSLWGSLSRDEKDAFKHSLVQGKFTELLNIKASQIILATKDLGMLVIFGDSLSDQGCMYHRAAGFFREMANLNHSTTGAFSDGVNWVHRLMMIDVLSHLIAKAANSESLKVDLTLATLENRMKGSKFDRLMFDGEYRLRNFSEGGASAERGMNFRAVVLKTLADQRQKFLEWWKQIAKENKWKPRRISEESNKLRFFILIGSNDLLTVNAEATIDIARRAVDKIIATVIELFEGTSKYPVLFTNFVIGLIPDLSLSPRFQLKCPSEQNNIHSIVNYFNAYLQSRVSALINEGKYSNISLDIYDINDPFIKAYTEGQFPSEGTEKERGVNYSRWRQHRLAMTTGVDKKLQTLLGLSEKDYHRLLSIDEYIEKLNPVHNEWCSELIGREEITRKYAMMFVRRFISLLVKIRDAINCAPEGIAADIINERCDQTQSPELTHDERKEKERRFNDITVRRSVLEKVCKYLRRKPFSSADKISLAKRMKEFVDIRLKAFFYDDLHPSSRLHSAIAKDTVEKLMMNPRVNMSFKSQEGIKLSIDRQLACRRIVLSYVYLKESIDLLEEIKVSYYKESSKVTGVKTGHFSEVRKILEHLLGVFPISAKNAKAVGPYVFLLASFFRCHLDEINVLHLSDILIMKDLCKRRLPFSDWLDRLFFHILFKMEGGVARKTAKKLCWITSSPGKISFFYSNAEGSAMVRSLKAVYANAAKSIGEADASAGSVSASAERGFVSRVDSFRGFPFELLISGLIFETNALALKEFMYYNSQYFMWKKGGGEEAVAPSASLVSEMKCISDQVTRGEVSNDELTVRWVILILRAGIMRPDRGQDQTKRSRTHYYSSDRQKVLIDNGMKEKASFSARGFHDSPRQECRLLSQAGTLFDRLVDLLPPSYCAEKGVSEGPSSAR